MIGFLRFIPLDHGAHGTINDEDPFLKFFSYIGRSLFLFRHLTQSDLKLLTRIVTVEW